MGGKDSQARGFIPIRKGFLIAGAVLLVVGLVIGGLYIYKGLDTKASLEKNYAEELRQKKIAELETKHLSLEAEIRPQLELIEELESEKTDELLAEDEDRYNAIVDEIEAIKKELEPTQEKMQGLKAEIALAENEVITVRSNSNMVGEYMPSLLIGGAVILVGIVLGSSVMTLAFRRNKTAFQIQAYNPIGSEELEDTAFSGESVTEETIKKSKKGKKFKE